jgi:hypothetical protein
MGAGVQLVLYKANQLEEAEALYGRVMCRCMIRDVVDDLFTCSLHNQPLV